MSNSSKLIVYLVIVMKDSRSRSVFIGPSVGMSIVCTVPLVVLKLLGVLELSWVWILCPLWLGWALCFITWLWLSTVMLLCKCIKPVFIPVFISSDSLEDKIEAEELEDGM